MAESDLNWRVKESDSGATVPPSSVYFQGYYQADRGQTPETAPVDTTTCKAYGRFKETLDNMRECFEVLNPEKGKVCGPMGPLASNNSDKSLDLHPYAMEFVRGGIVKVVALWEGYVKELMREAFTAAFVEGTKSLQELKAVWPECETAVQDALRKRADKPKSGEKLLLKAAFDTLLEEDGWRGLIKDHLDTCLGKLKTPIFDIPMPKEEEKEKEKGKEKEKEKEKKEKVEGIDATFKSLFVSKACKKSISEMMIEQNFSFCCRTGPHDTDTNTVTFKRTEELWNVTRLYFGIRCVFAHGDPKPTLNHALAKFPEDPCELFSEENRYAADHLLSLYRRVLKYNSAKVTVSYLTWVNMTRFFRTAAEKLFRAVAAYIYDSFNYPPALPGGEKTKLKLWGHNPGTNIDPEKFEEK